MISLEQAYEIIESGGVVIGLVDKAEALDECRIELSYISSVDQLERFNWSASCTGWWPLPWAGYYTNEAEAVEAARQLQKELDELAEQDQ